MAETATIGHCKDCKHWDKYRYPMKDSEPVGECQREHLPGALFSAQGYENSAALVTNFDFGCIQFEAKQ